jgi:chloramphenicol 3-O phosphotransferase
MTHLIVLTGSSGVGKSALARALQEELLPEQWLHFSVDTIFYCLPVSVTQRVDQNNDRSMVNAGSVVASALACARTLLDAGHKVVYDAVVANKNGASRLLSAFHGYSPMVVELTCTWDEIKRRTQERGDRTLQEAEVGFKNGRGHLTAHHVFDTTMTTPEQIARRLTAILRAAS